MPSKSLRDELQPFGDSAVLFAAVSDWGQFNTTHTRLPAGFDGEADVRAIAGDGLCSAPHWGFVISGSVGLRYADGREETASAGEVFYAPPGHAPFSREGAEVIEFTPAEAAAEMMAKAAALYGQG